MTTWATATLTIDLEAIAWNYRRLCLELGGVPCAAVVKADGYGLGAARVAPVLARAGASEFFVATLDEAIALRPILDGAGFPATAIFALNGPLPGCEQDLTAARVTPVLNSLADIDLWSEAARRRETELPAALHVDTGMSRLGLPDDEVATLADAPERLTGVSLSHILSHLACADTPEHPENAIQLARLHRFLAMLPDAPVSFANSSGVFLGSEYHFDLARPGVALYGVNPTPTQPNPMRRTVRLEARIMQVREIDASRGVGYGAAFRAQGPTRIATVAVGYADGYMRHLSNRGQVAIGGKLLPVVGRVSMDSITVDVTALGRDAVRPGDVAELLGAEHVPDALAREAGTIGYEVLTSLGARYHRVYEGWAD